MTSFSLDSLTARLDHDPGAIASFLYYMGLLTLTDASGRLKVPNLVVEKLFLERLLDIFLPNLSDGYAARETAMRFCRTGELVPLLAFFETRLLPVLSNRDRGVAPRETGRVGSGVNEMVIKTLLLSMLFDDTRYVTFSELELAQGYADLCLLVRPGMRGQGFFDLLFEIKLVRRKELAKTGRDLAELAEPELRRLPAVAKAFEDARGRRDATATRWSTGSASQS
ncbi:MAG: hypothetical protein HC897_10865 [Thermoanaerobaculia bacterium]|nr:hypothetical protein [Thermoanaerobaculia bacterium]